MATSILTADPLRRSASTIASSSFFVVSCYFIETTTTVPLIVVMDAAAAIQAKDGEDVAKRIFSDCATAASIHSPSRPHPLIPSTLIPSTLCTPSSSSAVVSSMSLWFFPSLSFSLMALLCNASLGPKFSSVPRFVRLLRLLRRLLGRLLGFPVLLRSPSSSVGLNRRWLR